MQIEEDLRRRLAGAYHCDTQRFRGLGNVGEECLGGRDIRGTVDDARVGRVNRERRRKPRVTARGKDEIFCPNVRCWENGRGAV